MKDKTEMTSGGRVEMKQSSNKTRPPHSKKKKINFLQPNYHNSNISRKQTNKLEDTDWPKAKANTAKLQQRSCRQRV